MSEPKKKKRAIRPEPNAKPLAIKGTFLDVFAVVKKHKEEQKKKDTDKPE